MAVIATSSSDPVASLRYRAMNGTVAPSASSAAVACTCAGRSFSSVAIFATCGMFTVDSLMMGGPSLVTAHTRQ